MRFMHPFSATAALLALMLSATSLPSLAYGQEAYDATSAVADTPLVIIRFNQRRVMYERQLYNAISKAVAIKPSVMFEIISYVPQTGNPSRNAQAEQAARAQLSGVVNSLRGMGIPQERMRISNQNAPGITAHEVHVYVE